MSTEISNITLIGTGLIGGSLGMAIKSHRPALQVTGWDKPESLKLAIRKDAIDIAASSLEESLQNADLVIIGTPLNSIPAILKEIAGLIPPDCLVTDLGSVKSRSEVEARSSLPESVLFIGGHPMAGSEKSGIEHADRLLFENATYVLCPHKAEDMEDPRAIALVDLLKGIGARILVMESAEHDKIAAMVSHLPQLVAVELVNLLKSAGENSDLARKLAAGGFRDMTRIASSPFGIWSDILSENKDNVSELLGQLISSLDELRGSIVSGDHQSVESEFDSAGEIRRSIPKDMKGFLHPLVDVYVYAEDKPGYLARLTTLLFENDLNIKDLELMKIREGTGGAFKLSFAKWSEAESAIEILEKEGYSAFQLS